MLARVTTLEVQPGKLDEAQRILRETVLPALRQQPGSAGIVSLTQPETSRAMVIAFWESQEALDAADEKGFWQSQVAQTIFLIASVPTREVYQVDVRE
jgi:hypothetical protein